MLQCQTLFLQCPVKVCTCYDNPVGRGDGGHGRGHGGYGSGFGGARGGGRGGGGHGQPSDGSPLGHGGPPGIDRNKLYCTHCGRTRHTRNTCWDLIGQPHRFDTVFTAESSIEKIDSGENDGSKGELDVNDKIQAIRKEI